MSKRQDISQLRALGPNTCILNVPPSTKLNCYLAAGLGTSALLRTTIPPVRGAWSASRAWPACGGQIPTKTRRQASHKRIWPACTATKTLVRDCPILKCCWHGTNGHGNIITRVRIHQSQLVFLGFSPGKRKRPQPSALDWGMTIKSSERLERSPRDVLSCTQPFVAVYTRPVMPLCFGASIRTNRPTHVSRGTETRRNSSCRGAKNRVKSRVIHKGIPRQRPRVNRSGTRRSTYHLHVTNCYQQP